MKFTTDQFRKILVEPAYVDAADFDAAVKESEKRGQNLEEVLVDKSIIPDDYLGQLVADAVGFPFVRVSVEKIPDHILRVIPERVAKKKWAIALNTDNRGCIRLAMHDPGDLEFIRLIEKKTGMRVVPYFATIKGIRGGFERYTKDLESAIKSLFEEYGRLDATGSAVEAARDDRIIRVVKLIMNYAYQSNASDVHIEPREHEVLVRYRIDGLLHDVVILPKNVVDPLLARIKILANLRTDEHMAAQDGKFQETIEGERIDVRVSILPVVEGEKIVMRLLAEKGKKFSLEDLGLLDRDLKKVKRHAQKSNGMILSTGPTGSGKTTTMYAVLKILNTRDVNIATIEDPIEYQIEGINQIQVNQRTGLTFAGGLRSIVRQDPDIIMIGEIRDEETAGIAVNAAMTGHLVLSTLHTNDAATTLPRLLDMKIEPFLIASSVNLIIAQRLVRHICPRCVVSHQLNLEEVKDRLSPELIKKYLMPRKKGVPLSVYRGKGCEACASTGYRGRIGVFEVLEVDDKVRELIMANANARTIAQQAITAGMTTMLEDGLQKVLRGMTTLDEVLRVTSEG